MFAEPGGEGQDSSSTPEIELIRDILLKDLRRSHEARMVQIEDRLAAISHEIDSKLGALAARIEMVAAETGQAQRQALMEIAHAIAQIASGVKLGEGAPGNAGS